MSPPSAARATSRASRLLPMPAFPTIVTRNGRPSFAVRRRRRCRSSSSSLRPTKGDENPPRSARASPTARCTATGSATPFSSTVAEGLELEDVARVPVRPFACHHGTRWSDRLKSCRDGSRFACDQSFMRVSRRGEHFAGVDRDPHREVSAHRGGDAWREVGEGRLHRQAGPHGAHRIVLVRAGHAEHPDDRVADELLDRAPVPLDHSGHRLEERCDRLSAAPRDRGESRAPSRLRGRRTARSRPCARPVPAAPAPILGSAGPRRYRRTQRTRGRRLRRMGRSAGAKPRTSCRRRRSPRWPRHRPRRRDRPSSLRPSLQSASLTGRREAGRSFGVAFPAHRPCRARRMA